VLDRPGWYDFADGAGDAIAGEREVAFGEGLGSLGGSGGKSGPLVGGRGFLDREALLGLSEGVSEIRGGHGEGLAVKGDRLAVWW
jgi:hypothetical protein